MKRVAWLTLVAAALFGSRGATAQPVRPPSEYAVKAAYLHNFIRFVRWPRPDTAVQLCIAGDDPFGPVLDATVAADPPGGRAVMVRRLAPADNASTCHVLFISASEEPRLASILAPLRMADVLTVSDMPGFVQRGGMMEFVNDRGRIRFEVQLTVTEASGLMLSSDLLRVARNVRRTP
jgi:hypothetical protein